MATTSPDNLRTPDPSSPYNLTSDLATLALDVQNALNTRGNTYKGTAAQRNTFSTAAINGMLWQDTDGIKMLWRKDGADWVPAVWSWSGTTTQMNAFDAPDGFEWLDVSSGKTYLRISGAWKIQVPNWEHQSLGTGSGNYPAPPPNTEMITKTGYMNVNLFGGWAQVVFPTAFPTRCLHVSPSILSGSIVSNLIVEDPIPRSGFRLGFTGMTNQLARFTWMAVGY